MKKSVHNYLMAFPTEDWNDLQTIKNKLDTPISQLLKEGLRLVVKNKKEYISQLRRQRETLSNMSSI